MELRGINYGPVHYASGGAGFEDPATSDWYHRGPDDPLYPDLTGATPSRKTVTLYPRDSNSGANMDLDDQLRPTEARPRCVVVNRLLCCSVNAVGLANEGLEAHLDRGTWQEYEDPQFISLMAIGETYEERMDQWYRMFTLLEKRKHEFRGPFAVQENHSCPTAGRDTGQNLLRDAIKTLELGKSLGIPQVPKFNVKQLSRQDALTIGNHEQCDALLLSNGIPWYDLPLWVRLVSFGTPHSPLRRRGIKQAGGYGGPYLLPLVENRVLGLRADGFTKPIIACGGVSRVKHVDRLHDAGVDAIEFATVILPEGWPWLAQPIIKRAHELWGC